MPIQDTPHTGGRTTDTESLLALLPGLLHMLPTDKPLPPAALKVLIQVAAVSNRFCEELLAPVLDGRIPAARLADRPAAVIAYAIGHAQAHAAYLVPLLHEDIVRLELDQQTLSQYREIEHLHAKLGDAATGALPIQFTPEDFRFARAAKALLELDGVLPVITDLDLFRGLTTYAIERTVNQLRKHNINQRRLAVRRAARRRRRARRRLDCEHSQRREQLRGHAHPANLQLGQALMRNLAAVDPGDLDVARFFAYSLLGADADWTDERTPAQAIAATGVRLVFDRYRRETRVSLRDGRTFERVTYDDPEQARRWMWKFIDSARTAGETYGRALVLLAAQHYAHDLVLPRRERRPSVIANSHRDEARNALNRITSHILPAATTNLARELEREADDYRRRRGAIEDQA